MAFSNSKTDQILAQFPGPVTLRQPPLENVLLFVASALFTAGGYWMIATGAPKGWPALLFFGLCSLVAVGLLFRPYTLTLEADGFQERNLFRLNPRALWQNVDGYRVIYFPFLPRRSVAYSNTQWADQRRFNLLNWVYGYDAMLFCNYGLSARELAELMALWQNKAMSLAQHQST